MSSKRSSNDPPEFYYKLGEKQQKNWMKNTQKMEKNEELKRKFPPFSTTSNITLIHLHYLTPAETLNELIVKANGTRRCTIDTESAKHSNQGALVQIEMIHSKFNSTIILIEIDFLPKPGTNLFRSIQELCTTIFDENNEIITWGSLSDEFKNFDHIKLFNIGNIKLKTNLQFEFRNYHNTQNTHPEMESRELTGQMFNTPGEFNDINYETTIDDSNCDCGHHTHYDSNGKWSLQDAIKFQFEQFIDKSLTINKWNCGLDLELNTWKKKLFRYDKYDPQYEQHQRLELIEYAKNDCLSVTTLYFYMYPNGKNHGNIDTYERLTTTTNINDNHETPTTITNSNIFFETPTTITNSNIFFETPSTTKSTNIIFNLENDLSDISEDELIELLKPKFDKKQATSCQPYDQPNELMITTTQQEINELNPLEEEQSEQEQGPSQQQLKKEQQRRKNQKLKWKQKHLPHFQNKIKRPIYHKYNYQKIRAQLLDDNIHTSHQITINRNYAEVTIGFKSVQEQQHATTIIKINYFSRDQYYKRWG